MAIVFLSWVFCGSELVYSGALSHRHFCTTKIAQTFDKNRYRSGQNAPFITGAIFLKLKIDEVFSV